MMPFRTNSPLSILWDRSELLFLLEDGIAIYNTIILTVALACVKDYSPDYVKADHPLTKLIYLKFVSTHSEEPAVKLMIKLGTPSTAY